MVQDTPLVLPIIEDTLPFPVTGFEYAIRQKPWIFTDCETSSNVIDFDLNLQTARFSTA